MTDPWIRWRRRTAPPGLAGTPGLSAGTGCFSLVVDTAYSWRRICQIGRSAVKTPLSAVNTIIAISAGLIVLAGYFVPGFDFLRDTLVKWAVILGGFALLVGVINLLSVHWSKVQRRGKGAVYSVVLIFSFFITVVVVGLDGPTGTWSRWLFENIQVPVEASLLALLSVTLAYAAMRLLHRRRDAFSIIFILALVLALLGTAPLYWLGEVSFLSDIKSWLANVPATAGARGILLGVALGTVATALRILMGADRPYGE